MCKPIDNRPVGAVGTDAPSVPETMGSPLEMGNGQGVDQLPTYRVDVPLETYKALKGLIEFFDDEYRIDLPIGCTEPVCTQPRCFYLRMRRRVQL